MDINTVFLLVSPPAESVESAVHGQTRWRGPSEVGGRSHQSAEKADQSALLSAADGSRGGGGALTIEAPHGAKRPVCPDTVGYQLTFCDGGI